MDEPYELTPCGEEESWIGDHHPPGGSVMMALLSGVQWPCVQQIPMWWGVPLSGIVPGCVVTKLGSDSLRHSIRLDSKDKFRNHL
jgi:hypothetical protein